MPWVAASERVDSATTFALGARRPGLPRRAAVGAGARLAAAERVDAAPLLEGNGLATTERVDVAPLLEPTSGRAKPEPPRKEAEESAFRARWWGGAPSWCGLSPRDRNGEERCKDEGHEAAASAIHDGLLTRVVLQRRRSAERASPKVDDWNGTSADYSERTSVSGRLEPNFRKRASIKRCLQPPGEGHEDESRRQT